MLPLGQRALQMCPAHAKQGVCHTGSTQGLAHGVAHLHTGPAECRPEYAAVPLHGRAIAIWRLAL